MSYQAGNRPGQELATGFNRNPKWRYGVASNGEDMGVVGDMVTPDSANIQAALNALALVAPGTALWLPLSYLIDAPIAVPSNIDIIFAPTSVIKSTVPSVPGNPASACFVAFPVLGASTTFSSATTRGSKLIQITSNLGGTIVKGSTLALGSSVPFHVTYRQVRSIVGVGPFTVQLDEPLLDVYGIGDPVTLVTSRPQNIRFFGNNALISGTGTRYIELDAALDCLISDFRTDDTFGVSIDLLFSFDTGGRRNCYSGMNVDCGIGSVGTVAMAFESNENSWAENCLATNAAQNGYAFFDCFSSGLINCDGVDCTATGCVFTGDGNAVGGRNNYIEGGNFTGNGIGIEVAFGADHVIAPAVCAGNVTAGIQVDATVADTVVSGQVGDTAGSGFINKGERTRVRDLVVQNCAAVGLDATTAVTDGLDIDGLTLLGSFGNAVQSNVDLRVRGLTARTVGAINVFLINAGRVDVEQARMNCGNGSNVFNNSGVLSLSDTVAVAAGGGIGIVPTAGTIRINESVDLDGCTTPISAGAGFINRATVVANGIVAVPVAWPDLKSTDRVTLTLNTPNPAAPVLLGTPSVTYTPGVGFTVTGTQALDASTYDYVVE